MTLSILPQTTFKSRWLKGQRTPLQRTCGSAYATPANLTSGSGPSQILAVTRTGLPDKDLRGHMTVV